MASIPDLSLLPAARLDPVAVISEQNSTRLPDLVPARIGRMLQSTFAFYRGTAALMAADLARTPNSGQQVLCCGDAHVSNFGFFASPERRLLFDLNDFDEAGLAPWEWDLKRLVTSVHLAMQDNGGSSDEAMAAVRATSAGYREVLGNLARRTAFERFYAAVDTQTITERFTKAAKSVKKIEKKARKRTSQATLKKLAVANDHGEWQILDQPPLMVHTQHVTPEQLADIWEVYLRSCSPEVRYLLRSFRYADHALRVVGVGSVGTRCYILLFTGPSGEPIFLQGKEAGPSVLESHGGMDQSALRALDPTSRAGEGFRIVSSQRILQAFSDPFLGWVDGGPGQGEGLVSDFYVRQFRDMKGSVDLSQLSGGQLTRTATVCAALLARAHAQSAGILEIAEAWAGAGELDDQMAEFARGYAQIAVDDAAALRQAADDGRVPVAYGV